MFHAESGLKKGPAVSMARQLVESINNTKIISGRSSIQGILKEMGMAKTEPGGRIPGGSTAFICSSELTSSIVDDPVAIKILTDLYDRNYNVGTWKSLLKMESFSLKNPTITMLTATNEAMSDDFFNKIAIKGGYFARTFIVYERERNKINSLIVPPEHIPDYKKSAEYIKELSKLRGSFIPLGSRKEDEYHSVRISGSPHYYTEAGAVYEEWYQEFIQTMDSSDSKDETGTLNRFGDSVLKVAILLSLIEKPELSISPTAMKTAIDECKKLVGGTRRVTFGKSGISASADLKTRILTCIALRDPPQITRDTLMRKFWMDFVGPTEMDELLSGLEQSKVIKTQPIGNTIMIIMTELEAKRLKEHFMGEIK